MVINMCRILPHGGRLPLTRTIRIAVRLLLLLAIAAGGTLAAEETAHYKSMVVRFTIAPDGSLHVTERDEIEVPPGVTAIERTYTGDGEQRVTFNRVMRVEPDGSQALQKVA